MEMDIFGLTIEQVPATFGARNREWKDRADRRKGSHRPCGSLDP
jgi:hypothetical protein